MLIYAQRRDNLIIQEGNEIFSLSVSITAYLNQLLLPNFRELSALEKAVKSHFGWSSMIPIWVDSQTLLFPIFSRRAKDSLYVNYLAIQNIRTNANTQTIITFINGSEMRTSSRRSLRKQMARCGQLREWMELKQQ